MAFHPTTCPLDCPDACGILVESDESGRFVRLGGNPAHSYTAGTLCGKTAIYSELIQSPERLDTPLLRNAAGEFEVASWEHAIEVIARRVKPLGVSEILALHYAGNMGRVARSFPMRVLGALGAVETDGGICDNTSSAGYEIVLGNIVGPDIETVRGSDLLVLWGIDVKRTHQHLQPQIQELCERGVPVIAIDIYRTDTIRALERWGGRGLVLHPGTDAMLALCLARLAFERGYADEAALAECVGADMFREHVLAGHDLEEAARVTGIDAPAISSFADLLGNSERPFLKTGVGFGRRRNGGMNMRSVCSLGAVLGHADRVHYESSDHFGLEESGIARADLRPTSTPAPIRHVATGRELETGRFKACFVWGHNPAVTIPDTRRVRAGLAREDLFLVVHEQFLTETAQLADVVLPATTFVEQSDVIKSYGHRVLQYAKMAVPAPGQQRSNVETFAAIGRALGLPAEVWDETEESLCEQLLKDSRGRFTPAEFERLLAGEPTKLAPRTFADRGTPSGRIELFSEAAGELGQPLMATFVRDEGVGGGAFQLIPAPSIATHNSTFSHSSRHASRAGEPLCHANPADLARLGIADGSSVTLSNQYGQLTLPAHANDDMPPGILRIDGLPLASSFPENVGLNALTSPEVSDIGDGNVLYSTRVDIKPAD